MRGFNQFLSTWLAAGVFAAFLVAPCRAQELEPRRWSHLPVGVNFAGCGYVYTDAEIAFDPVLRLEDVSMKMHSMPVKYIRTFELLGKSARFDWLQFYQTARWTGSVDGVPGSTTRTGWSDMSVRFAVNLLGAPPLRAEDFAKYRAGLDSETILGLGLVAKLPTGYYLQDRFLNLGENRFTFRPQLGFVHNRGKWSTEVTAASRIYTNNDEFYGDNFLQQNPLYAIEGHVDYTFRPGLWAGAGIGYGRGGETTLNGVRNNNELENIGWQVSFGYPITRQLGLKFAYVGMRTLVPVGSDSDNFLAALSVLW